MSDSPSARIVAAGNVKFTITDENGRVIAYRNLGALDRMHLLKAAGPDLAKNEPWIGNAALAFMVTEIDGVPVPMPRSVATIEALVSRLDDAGINAIAADVMAKRDAAKAADDEVG